MPFDLNGLFESIVNGASKMPSAVLAALFLGGPTAIWLITRFVNPPELVKSVEVVTEDRLWLCGSCLSINEDRHDQCYRCHQAREAESVPVVIHGGLDLVPRIGIAPGPALIEPLPAGWLGGELNVAALTTKARKPSGKATPSAKATTPEPATPPEPATRPEPAPMPAQAIVPDEAPHFEPTIIEPRVKVSTRAAGSKPAKRRTRKPQGAGEAN